MSTEYVSSEIHDNIGIITLNNPKSMNSVNEKMLTELAEQVTEYNSNPNVKVIILKGIEKSFATGIDIKELASNIGNARNIIKNMQQKFDIIVNTDKPLIAVITGFALGIGCEIALACDIILATDNAKFGLPELSIGLLPCFGGCKLLASRIGKAKALDMILTGKAMTADEAERAGLISRIVNDTAIIEEYTKIAQRIALLPEYSISTAKKLVREIIDKPNLEIEKTLCLSHIESGELKKTLLNFANKNSSES